MLTVTTRIMPIASIGSIAVLSTGTRFGPLARSFAFGPFVLQPECQLLLKDGVPVRLGGRALEILTALAERPGELVSKQELMARVWPNVCVEESNLKTNVAHLRRVLGDRPDAPLFIATVVGRGYRFIAPTQVNRSAARYAPATPYLPYQVQMSR